MNRYFALLMLLAFCISAAPAQSAPACVTHFYNKSNYQWSIANFDGKNTSLLIAPNSTIEIHWSATNSVTIGGNVPNRPYIRKFEVQAVDSCVTIQHQGATGNVSLNKPGNGDITTCAGGC